MSASPRPRIVFLDFMRVFACLSVMCIHSGENYYCGPDCTIITSTDYAPWVALLNGLFRFSVPVFAMTSSYLLLPLKDDASTFFRRRFSRICWPFVVWMLIYALIPQWGGSFADMDYAHTLPLLLVNIPGAAGHLWFIYMLLGLYLIMPILTPWLRQVSRRGEEAFLCVWLFTTLIPFVRLIPGCAETYGVVPWNQFGLLWNVSGYIGYIVLAHYIRQYLDWSVGKTLRIAVPLFLLGWAMTSGWFYECCLYWAERVGANPGEMFDGGRDLYNLAETSFQFCTLNVVLQSFAIFMLFKAIRTASDNDAGALSVNPQGRWYRLVQDISRKSFGMYLLHIFCLGLVFPWVASWDMCVPLTILIGGVLTFVLSYLVTSLLSLLPGSKYYIG